MGWFRKAYVSTIAKRHRPKYWQGLYNAHIGHFHSLNGATHRRGLNGGIVQNLASRGRKERLGGLGLFYVHQKLGRGIGINNSLSFRVVVPAR